LRLSQNITYSCIRRAVPNLDMATIQAVKNKVPCLDLDIDQTTLPTSTMVIDKLAESSWKLRVKVSMNEIIAPETITWMEVEETMTIDQYAQCAMDDIKERFTKCVCCCNKVPMPTKSKYRDLRTSTASSRKELAKELAKLVCLFAHSNSLNCTSTSKLSTPFLAVYLAILPRLLDGTQEEITHDVRRAVYDAVARVVKHSRSSHDGLDSVTVLITRGIRDQDRDIRLRAGFVHQCRWFVLRLTDRCSRVLVEVVGVCMTPGVATKQRYEPLFSDLRRALDTAKGPIKETSMVTMGLLGKQESFAS
jgi:serine/threonine-protein kinase ATR